MENHKKEYWNEYMKRLGVRERRNKQARERYKDPKVRELINKNCRLRYLLKQKRTSIRKVKQRFDNVADVDRLKVYKLSEISKKI